MIDAIATLGRQALSIFSRVGASGQLLYRTLFRLPNFRKGFPLFLEQVYSEGVLSLIIIFVSGLFILFYVIECKLM